MKNWKEKYPYSDNFLILKRPSKYLIQATCTCMINYQLLVKNFYFLGYFFQLLHICFLLVPGMCLIRYMYVCVHVYTCIYTHVLQAFAANISNVHCGLQNMGIGANYFKIRVYIFIYISKLISDEYIICRYPICQKRICIHV